MDIMNDYDEWVKRHAKIFGLVNEIDMGSMLAWKDALGATVDELNEATAHLAANPQLLSESLPRPAQYEPKMTRHLLALKHRISERRAVEATGMREHAEETWGTCTICNSSGWVIVPHPSGLKDSEWVPIRHAKTDSVYYATIAVTCSCKLGRWIAGRQVNQAMCLATYERLYGRYWKLQMDQRRQEQSAMAEAIRKEEGKVTLARHDASLDRLVKSVANSMAEGWRE